MRHLDLFSGIGGFALAARWARIDTVAFCEIDEFPRKVLAKNFPNVPMHGDIKDLDGGQYEGIDIITGGYPCQPFSVAGGQKAQKDDRHLWPEMFRVISQAKPSWVICENVFGHIKLGLDKVLHDLEGLGYAVQSFIIPALATGEPHNRDRLYIVAYSASHGLDESKATRSNGTPDEHGSEREDKDCDHEGLGSLRAGMEWAGNTPRPWGIEPPEIRVDDGLPDRMDRNKSVGNAIDPHVAFNIMKSIVAMG